MTGTVELSAPAGADSPSPGLPPIIGLSGTVGSDRRFVLNWSLDPVYEGYEIHESTADPANTLKSAQGESPRTSGALSVRSTPLRYGVRGKTDSGAFGPFSNAVEVLVREAGGTVTVTDEQFVLPNTPSTPEEPEPPTDPLEPGEGGGTSTVTGVGVTWLIHPDATPVKLATGGGNAAETTATSIAAVPASGVVRYTGPTISSEVTLSGKSNLTLIIDEGKMSVGGSLVFSGGTTNVRLEINAPYENTNGKPIVFVRKAYDTVTVINSVFGPATRAATPGTTKSRFVMFGDSASAGSRHGSVVLSTLRNKNGPGNPVHAAGNTSDAAGTGGVRYTYIGLNWIWGTQPFDENDHESALLGLSNMQLTDGQQLVEGNLFGGPDAAVHGVASEPEVVSMKMNKSVIRGNTFWNHVGSASLRHGDDGQIVHNNFRSNNKVEGTGSAGTSTRCAGGGRLYGKGHRFASNTVWVMDGAPTQKFERPFLADSGDVAPGTTNNGHAHVQDLMCEDNLFYRCGNGGGPIFDGENFSVRATGTVQNNFIVACPSPGPNGVTVIGSGSSQLAVSGNQIHASAPEAGVALDANGWPTHPVKGSKAPCLNPTMVGKGGTWRPPGWTGSGPAKPATAVPGGGTVGGPTTPPAPGDPQFPGDLIPVHWKLTTTLQGPTPKMPLEIWRDGRSSIGGNRVDLDTYVHPDHWRLTHEQGRWGIKITCPATGFTTPNSDNMRWELRGTNTAGDDEFEFDLVEDAPILDTELCVLDLQGNHAVLSQIHGQDTDGKNDDLTVWRAEPNSGGSSYSLWITKGDKAHGHLVDSAVAYGQVIKFGFRPAKDRVRYVYNGQQLSYEMEADFSTVNFYRAGLYLQVKAGASTKGTIILYRAEISGM
jgi:hypothetical protein